MHKSPNETGRYEDDNTTCEPVMIPHIITLIQIAVFLKTISKLSKIRFWTVFRQKKCKQTSRIFRIFRIFHQKTFQIERRSVLLIKNVNKL